jgi:hypothetical protein
VYVVALLSAGCGASAARTDLRAAAYEAAPASGSGDAAVSAADLVEIVRGVPDRNRDPAVVAVSIGDAGLCSGTLISPRLVLTARHCTSRTVSSVSCPPSGVQVLGDRDPTTLSIIVGDDVASGHRVARGVAVVAPSGTTLCEADIAVIVLEKDVKFAKPLPVRRVGVARGDRVRAVGFGQTSDDANAPAGVKLVREHVRVTAVGPAEFTVGEATCHGDSGGPALDEDTGEVVGVVSRGGPSCTGPSVHNIYTRVDTLSWVVDEAFAKVAGLDHELEPDGGTPPAPATGSKQKPPTDLGGPCTQGTQCAAGVCIVPSSSGGYCSRECGTGDRCPTRYHCKPVASPSGGPSTKACLAAE